MKIRDFIVAHALFIEKSGNEDIKLTGVLVSDINHNDQITESTWEKQCEHLRKNATCKKCNCFMIVKVAIPMLHCPIDKW